jgi:hypothetical protein
VESELQSEVNVKCIAVQRSINCRPGVLPAKTRYAILPDNVFLSRGAFPLVADHGFKKSHLSSR